MSKLEKIKDCVPPVVDLILCTVGTLCLFTGFLYLAFGNVILASTGLGSGLLLLFSATINRFEVLKGLGLEAKTRVLDKTIDEANDTLILLRQLAEISCRTMSSLVARVGRSTFTVTESHKLAKEIRKNLNDLKADPDAVMQALRPWVQGLCSELAEKLSMDFATDYNEIERSLIQKLEGIPYDPSVLNLEREDLINRFQSVERHRLNAIMAAQQWPAEEVLDNLRSYVLAAPDASEEFKTKHITLIKNWDDEVNFLLKNSDLKTPKIWIDKFHR